MASSSIYHHRVYSPDSRVEGKNLSFRLEFTENSYLILNSIILTHESKIPCFNITYCTCIFWSYHLSNGFFRVHQQIQTHVCIENKHLVNITPCYIIWTCKHRGDWHKGPGCLDVFLPPRSTKTGKKFFLNTPLKEEGAVSVLHELCSRAEKSMFPTRLCVRVCSLIPLKQFD